MSSPSGQEPESKQQRKSLNRAVLRRVAGLFKPHKGLAIGTALVVLVSSVLGVAPPFLLQLLIDRGLMKGDLGLVTRLSLLTVVVVLSAAGLTLVYGWMGATIGQRIMCKLRSALFTHLQGMSLKFFSATRTGDIQTRLISDIGGIQTAVSSTLTDAMSNLIIFVTALFAMFYMDWRLTLATLLLMPLFMFMGNWVGEFARKVRKGTQEQTSEMNSMMQENLSVSGILLAKTLGRSDLVHQRFEKENALLAKWQIKSVLLQYAFFGMIRMITQVIPAIVYAVAAFLIARGDTSMSVGKLVAFTALQMRLFFPLTGIVSLQVELISSVALFERIFEYLDIEQDVKNRPGAKSLAPDAVRGQVAFKGVGFQYEGTDEKALDNIEFVANPGELVALVGPSGAGKTTLTYMIPRLYDVEEGSVEIDGIDIRDIQLADLGSIVGAVTQEPYLMHTTISENLRVAKPDATQTELEEACKAAAIHDHIASLPEAYETIVGERGYKLSGGEKQRLSIARAILKNPRILILDEATSALDTRSERLIQESLDGLMKGRTTFAIAHRLSTILDADRILVMRDGRIVEQGRHDELLAKKGLYSELYNEQFRATATVS